MSCATLPACGPKAKRVVTDDHMRAAMADPKIRGFLDAELAKYSRSLDPDQRESAGLWALKRCLESHDEKRQEFNSSLWRYIRWECNRELKKERRRSGYGRVTRADADLSELEVTTPEAEEEMRVEGDIQSVVDAMNRFLPEKTRDIIHLHYLEKRPLDEVGERLGMSKEACRQAMDRGLRFLQQVSTTSADNLLINS
jgi:RNA polymerase sigma factor (sigma-70 family)